VQRSKPSTAGCSAEITSWSRLSDSLDAVSLQQLLRNEIAAIVVPGFASAAECASLAERATRIGFESYRNVAPPIERIGITVFEYDVIGMERYFQAADAARRIQREVFASSFDPVERFIRLIAEHHHGAVSIATDPEFGRYFAGLVRRIEDGTMLHVDYAPAEHPAWCVGQVRCQLAWNVYVELESPEAGWTHIFNRPWQPALEGFKIPDSYGYRRDLLDGVEQFSYRPALGDLFLFNTRNFHEVAPGNGNRMTINSAVGLFEDGALLLWS
jgi:hypothetical protein